jgi:hypothetical protein
MLLEELRRRPGVGPRIAAIEAQVRGGAVSPTSGARKLLDLLRGA